jgi:hypothetical protein
MKFFRKKKEVSIKEFVVKSIANLLNEGLNITLIDPEHVLSSAERDDVIHLGRPFAIAMLYRATLKEIETRNLPISAQALVQHFLVGIYMTFRDNKIPDLDKTTEEIFERVQRFLQSAAEIAPENPDTEITRESVFATAFARDVLPDCNIGEPLPQKKWATVVYFAMTLQESLSKHVHAFFNSFTITG